MAYERPKQWVHGDIPVDSDLNRYSNSLTYLEPFFVSRQFFALRSQSDDGVPFALRKRFRWLHYIVATNKSDGEITDPTGVNDTVSLTKGEGSWVVLDLNGVDWLTPGKLYVVKDCVIAMESEDTPTASTLE